MQLPPTIPWLDVFGAVAVVGLFSLLLFCEHLRPLRKRVQGWFTRLRINFLFAVPAFLVIRLLLIPVVVAVSVWGERHQVGIARWLGIPATIAPITAFLILDYTMYLWHWLNHRVPFLWRFHNVHHTDLDLDVTTAMRFHFGEMIFSVGIRSIQVLLAGASPLVVIVYEICLEASTQFHHSNLRLPPRFERILSWFVVTPRVHGIHHSMVERETNSNFSNLLLVWDRLHGTARLDVPQDQIVIGVPTHRDPDELTLWQLLTMPFRHQRRAGQQPPPPGG